MSVILKQFTRAVIGFVVMNSMGCGGLNTARPVYEGLIADTAFPKKSERKMGEIKQAPNVVVVLSQSTRDTIDGFKDGREQGYPVDKWILQMVKPVKEVNAGTRIAQDLRSRPSGSWTVVIHWAALFEPFVIGGTIEYHVLDQSLAVVAVIREEKKGNCDSLSFDANVLQEHYVKCYDGFLSALIEKAGARLIASAGQ